MYAIHNSTGAVDAALRLCRGDYQRNLIRGIESLSGSTLRGKAARYHGRYMASARNLIERCRAAGIAIRETRGAHGKRTLVIG